MRYVHRVTRRAKLHQATTIIDRKSIAQIARLEGLKNSVRGRLIRVDVARNKVDSCGVRLTRRLRIVYRLVS